MWVGLVPVVVANLGGFDNFDGVVMAPVARAAAPAVAFEVDGAVGVLVDGAVFKMGRLAARMGLADLNPRGCAACFVWNHLEIQCAGDLVALLCLFKVERHDIRVAITKVACEELQQGRVNKGSLEKSERVLGLEEASKANKGKSEDL